MSNYSSQRLLRRLLACILVGCMCAVLFANAAVSAAEEEHPIWSGTDSYGSLEAVLADLGETDGSGYYHIKTAEQLHGVIRYNGGGHSYRLDNDLYLNGDYENYASWGTSAPANTWDFTGHSDKVPNYQFYGTVDGGYHTVYGLYSGSTYYAGLFGGFKGNADTVIKNLEVRDSYIRATMIGGVIAGGHWWSTGNGGQVTLTGVSVRDAVVNNVWNNGSTGGLVGVMGQSLTVNGCSVTGVAFTSGANATDPNGTGSIGAFVGASYTNTSSDYATFVPNQARCATIRNSFAVNNTVTDKANAVTKPYIVGLYRESVANWTFSAVADRVYTDSTDISKSLDGSVKLLVSRDGQTAVDPASPDYPVKTVTAEAITGAGAKTAMPELDWETWATTEDDYPVYTSIEIWDGRDEYQSLTQLYSFMEGNGTEEDPYMIEDAGQLHAAIRLGGGDKVYKLAHNLYLNDNWENYAGWANGSAPANNWGLSGSDITFSGTIDGDNHAIYGYFNNAIGLSPDAKYAGLIPAVNSRAGTAENVTIKNLDMLYCSTNGNTAAGFFIGYTDFNGTGSVLIDNCSVRHGIFNLLWDGNNAGTFVGRATGSTPVTISNCIAEDIDFKAQGDGTGGFGHAGYGSLLGATRGIGSADYDTFDAGQATSAKLLNSIAIDCINLKTGKPVYVCGISQDGATESGQPKYSFCVTAQNVYTDATEVSTAPNGAKVLVSEDGLNASETAVRLPESDRYEGLFSTGYWYMGLYSNGSRPILKSRTADFTCLDITGEGIDDAYKADDLAYVRKHLIGVKDYAHILADVNGDGSTDIRDLVRLKKALA